MRFTPKSEAEISNLLKEGEGTFTVESAVHHISGTGNEMIKLTLKVKDSLGKEAVIVDYLMEALAYKLRHFCVATGLKDEYESGSLQPNSCNGKRGKCKIKTEVDKENKYPPKSKVSDYMALDEQSQQNTPLQELFIRDDDIPF